VIGGEKKVHGFLDYLFLAVSYEKEWKDKQAAILASWTDTIIMGTSNLESEGSKRGHKRSNSFDLDLNLLDEKQSSSDDSLQLFVEEMDAEDDIVQL
jgi:hypothetical protein